MNAEEAHVKTVEFVTAAIFGAETGDEAFAQEIVGRVLNESLAYTNLDAAGIADLVRNIAHLAISALMLASRFGVKLNADTRQQVIYQFLKETN